MYILKKSTQKLKNIFSLMTTFYNFTLKIETSWAEKVGKAILETRNAVNDVIVYVSFIHSLIKFLKNVQYKKE